MSTLVASCAGRESLRLSSPTPDAFEQEPAPKLDPIVVIDNDEEGYRRHQQDKDEWGERGWAALNRVCLWFEDQGANGLPCKPVPATPKP